MDEKMIEQKFYVDSRIKEIVKELKALSAEAKGLSKKARQNRDSFEVQACINIFEYKNAVRYASMMTNGEIEAIQKRILDDINQTCHISDESVEIGNRADEISDEIDVLMDEFYVLQLIIES